MNPQRTNADFDLTGRWVLFYVGYDYEVDEIEITQSGTTLTFGNRLGTIDPATGSFEIIILDDERCPDPPFRSVGTVIDADHFKTKTAGYAPWIGGAPCRFRYGFDVNGVRAEIAPPTRTPLPSSTPRPTRTPAPTQTPGTNETPAPTTPPVSGIDMSGQWRIISPVGNWRELSPGGEEIVEIKQQGSRLIFSDPYDHHFGSIDQAGRFTIALREVPECPGENTLSGFLTADANYFDGRYSVHVLTNGTCVYHHGWTVYGTRVGVPPRPTATVQRSPSPTPTRDASSVADTPTRTCTPGPDPAPGCAYESFLTPTATVTPLSTARPSPTELFPACCLNNSCPSLCPTPRDTPIPPASCVGDCDRNQIVSIDELVLLVNVAIDRAAVAQCPILLDRPQIDYLVQAVNRAIGSCPDGPPPTETPAALTPSTPTPTPTGCATASPPSCPTGSLPLCRDAEDRCDPGCACATLTPTYTPGRNPSPTQTTTSSVPHMPDLLVTDIDSIHVSAPCQGPFAYVYVCVKNAGDLSAGPFDVAIAEVTVTASGLSPGATECFQGPALTNGPRFIEVTVDPGNLVAESDERNNVASGNARFPTVPATCRPTATTAPTPSPR